MAKLAAWKGGGMSGDVKAKVPAIRFAGFDEEWQEQQIAQVLEEKKRPITLNDNQKYELITVKRRNAGIVSRGHLLGKEILVKNYYQLKENDFVISKRQVVHGATGIIPESLNDTIASNEYLVVEDNNKLSTGFLNLLSCLPKMKKDFFLSSYGVDIEKLFFDVEDWKKRLVTIPKKTEQIKIKDFFEQLDKDLEQQQNKLDKLNNLKQAMLQKMFPQGDAVVPEIRFQGFAGEWKKHQLSNIGDIIGGGTPSTGVAKYWNGNIDWYSPTEIGSKVYADGSVKKITKEGLEKSSAKILPANRTILFTSRAGIGDTAILRHEGCTNQGFQSLVLNDGIDPYFIYSMAYLIKNYALKYASGSTFLEISSKQLGKMSLLLPNEEEQQKIGNYFRKLDELIALHQTQLEKLKQIKLGCLGRMFV